MRELAGERLTKGFIAQVEGGLCRPSAASLTYLAERLGAPLEEFLAGDEHPGPLLDAVQHALRRGRPAEAARLLDRAETAGGGTRVARLRAEVAEAEGRLTEALALAETAARVATTTEERIRSLNVVGRLHHGAGRVVEALTVVEQACALAAGPGVSTTLRATVESNRGIAHYLLGDRARARAAFTTALAAAEAGSSDEDVEERGRACRGLGVLDMEEGALESSVVMSLRAADHFAAVEFRNDEALARHNAGHALQLAGRLDEARACHELAIRVAVAAHAPGIAALALERLATLELLAGDEQAALDRAREGIDLAGDDAGIRALLLAIVGRAEAARGNLTAAHGAFAEARRGAEGPSRQVSRDQVWRTILSLQAQAMAAAGDSATAFACYEELFALSG